MPRFMEGLTQPPTMALDLAVEIVEGENDYPDEWYVAAWQYLHSSGHAYRLQGRYGRTAQHLLATGRIKP